MSSEENRPLGELINPEFLGIIWITSSRNLSSHEIFYELDHIFDGLLAERALSLEDQHSHGSLSEQNHSSDFFLTYLYDQSFFLLISDDENKIISHLKLTNVKNESKRNKIAIINKKSSFEFKKVQNAHNKLEFIFLDK